MAKSYEVIGYTADAACWCPACAEKAYPGCTEDDATVEDGEGNEVHPIFAGDEGSESGEYCNDCGECIREPEEAEEEAGPNRAGDLSEDDIDSCFRHNEERMAGGPDDGGPDVVMIGEGYAELWLDGDVVMHGKLVGNIYGGE